MLKNSLINYETYSNIRYILQSSQKFQSNTGQKISLVFQSESYRLIINDINRISFVLKNNNVYDFKNMNDIFRILKLNQSDEFLSGQIIFQKKEKISPIFKQENYGLSTKMSRETTFQNITDINTILSGSNNELLIDIVRIRHRDSYYLKKNNKIVIDVSKVTQAQSVSEIIKKQQEFQVGYEIELEFSTSDKEDCKQLPKIKSLYDETLEYLLRNIQQSQFISSQEDQLNIFQFLTKIEPRNVSKIEQQQNLIIPQPISFEEQFIGGLDQYYVTDKADGNRTLLLIQNDKIYSIQPNGQFNICGKINSSDNEKKVLFDSEILLFDNVSVCMIFDIYFAQHSYAQTNLLDRLADIISLINTINSNLEFKIEYKLRNKFDSDEKYLDYHFATFKKHLEQAKEKKKSFILFPKFFLIPKNIDKNDVFKLGQFIYDYQKQQKIPYENDGIIFTFHGDLQSTYSENKSIKWKPNELNTVDLLVRFQRNNKNQIETFVMSEKKFIIANLLIKTNEGLRSYPTFHQTFILLDGEMPIDVYGNPINDNTVVEFVFWGQKMQKNINYHQNATKKELIELIVKYYSIDSQQMNDDIVIPLKTRKDKSNSSNPNALKTAQSNFKIYKQFKSKLTEDKEQIQILIDKFFEQYSKTEWKRYYVTDRSLRRITKNMRIFHRIIKYVFTEFCFMILDYLSVSNQQLELRDMKTQIFNFISQLPKDKLIDNTVATDFLDHVSKKIIRINNSVGQYNIIDIGSGTGGDFNKIKHRAEYLVMVEPSESDIAEAKLKIDSEKINCKFINCKAEDPFHNQLKIQFDLVNCQMMIHYLLNSSNQFDQFLENIDKITKKNSIINLSFMDGDNILNLMEIEQKKELLYQDEGHDIVSIKLINPINQKHQKLKYLNEEFLKKYGNQFGRQINVRFFDFMNDYYPENLVNKSMLIDAFELLGFKLVNNKSYNFVTELNSIGELQFNTYKRSKIEQYFYDNVSQNMSHVSQLFNAMILIRE
ncbi:hypothetical protein ABPG72_008161 [Tetrahymena utriculariae]